MGAIEFLGIENVLMLHEDTLAADGGAPGLRDRGMLESAVSMPEQTFGGEFLHVGIPAMAAAYLFHICQAHAFVDGNKRTATLAMLTFLDLNGYSFGATQDELVATVTALADGSLSKDDVTRWVSGHASKA